MLSEASVMKNQLAITKAKNLENFVREKTKRNLDKWEDFRQRRTIAIRQYVYRKNLAYTMR